MPSEKLNRLFLFILSFCLIILLKVWHLGVIQRDEKVLASQRPKERAIILKPKRGTITDRFGIPLATNTLCYNVSIYFGQIAEQYPTLRWVQDRRTFPKKEYIERLSCFLGKMLNLDPVRLKEEILYQASILPHAPYSIQTELSEELYYQLKAQERCWPGLHAEMGSKRKYPLGKVGCHILGTLGSISLDAYQEISHTMKHLQEAMTPYFEGRPPLILPGYRSFEEQETHLFELKERSYTLSDLVGKSGLEATFEKELKGFVGKKRFEVDQKGRFLRDLPGSKEPTAGQDLKLTISAELQQFAEELLIQSEKTRDGRSLGIDPVDQKRKPQKQPWIKGGAIVALDPKTNEILALASNPRFDPNDFIPSPNATLRKTKQLSLQRWLETENSIGAIWDGRATLYREFGSQEETRFLSWKEYLYTLFPKEGELSTFFEKNNSLKMAIQIQEDFTALTFFAPEEPPQQIMEDLFSSDPNLAYPVEMAPTKKRLKQTLETLSIPLDRLFAIDLCKVSCDASRFSDELLEAIGNLSLEEYQSFSQQYWKSHKELEVLAKQAFRQGPFARWKEAHFDAFLKEERKRRFFCLIERLDRKEKELFEIFWKEHHPEILLTEILKEDLPLTRLLKTLSPSLQKQLIHSFRSFSMLDRPLLYAYPKLRKKSPVEKDLAAAFYPKESFGFTKSYAYQASAPLGSIFKLITAYEGLRQKAQLTIIDEFGSNPKLGQIVAYSPSKKPYPRIYKGGRLPKSQALNIGKVDLIGALEQSSNPFFSILAGDCFSDPEDLLKAARSFGFGEKTGIPLPAESKGNLPNDLKKNRTGLYSFAIGQHTLLSTPLQTAVALGALANQGHIKIPSLVQTVTGAPFETTSKTPLSLENAFAKQDLEKLGFHFALFTAANQTLQPDSQSLNLPPKDKRSILMTPSIQTPLFQGMDRTIWSEKGRARPNSIRSLLSNRTLKEQYQALEHQMIGKTSTSEILANLDIHPSGKASLYKHVWFGSIAFEEAFRFEAPELIVVVFLRYGDAGKEGAPLASQMIHKWREIKKSHN